MGKLSESYDALADLSNSLISSVLLSKECNVILKLCSDSDRLSRDFYMDTYLTYIGYLF